MKADRRKKKKKRKEDSQVDEAGDEGPTAPCADEDNVQGTMNAEEELDDDERQRRHEVPMVRTDAWAADPTVCELGESPVHAKQPRSDIHTYIQALHALHQIIHTHTQTWWFFNILCRPLSRLSADSTVSCSKHAKYTSGPSILPYHMNGERICAPY